MRNAMICTTIMMAIFLAWPMAFGDDHRPGFAPGPARAEALAFDTPVRTTPIRIEVRSAAITDRTVPASCQKRYEQAYSGCAIADRECRITAGEDWDICDQTGFWPE